MSQKEPKKAPRRAVKRSITGEAKASLIEAVLHRDYNAVGKFLLETMSKAEIREVLKKYNETARADEEVIRGRMDLCEEVYTELGRIMMKLMDGCMKLFKSGTTQHFTTKCVEMSYKLYKLDS